MLCEQQQRLLPTHSAADGIQMMCLQAKPGQRAPDKGRHPRQIADLTMLTPRIRALTIRRNDRETTKRRQVTPQPQVGTPTHRLMSVPWFVRGRAVVGAAG